MDVIKISDEDIEDFLPILGEDLAEDLKRVYFNGIGILDDDDEPTGAFVYELLNSESEEDTKSKLHLIKSATDEISDSLSAYYANTCVMENSIVESFYELPDESDAKLLVRSGFSLEKKEDDTLSITLEDLSKTVVGKKKKIPDYIGNIEDLSILQFRKAVKEILFKGHSGILEDIPFLPKGWFDNQISACVNSGEKICGLFLIRRTPSGLLIPVLIFSFGPEFQKNLLYMIRYSTAQALNLYPPETMVKICRKNPATRALTNKLLPNSSETDIFFGTRKEGVS